MSSGEMVDCLDEIAIIGMTGRFPRAGSVDEFWENLRDGVESVSVLSDQELEASGVDAALLENPDYVKAAVPLEGVELFDATFFGFSPREAELMDPQQRLFLECAWEALESAGYAPDTFSGRTGVYAGVGMNTYLLFNLYSNAHLRETADRFQLMVGNDKDFLSTRVSYKLNLTGPSLTVQTACSTSLVAVHLACQSLLNGECDMALAGGVSIRVPQRTGYLFQSGGIFSPDGHCRAFDERAQGTMFGSGVGIVVLKRLADAQSHGDYIHAIIKGSAINNDGSLKVGYTAPAVDSQADVIAEAHAISAVAARTISYVETHGTGTPMGDPMEIEALAQAFRVDTDDRGFCAIGSVKTNIGHLDTAAGVAGLIKTVLALKHKQVPPSLNFERPNPRIDFAGSQFYVNAKLSDWQAGPTPRRAGVSSFGIGGTNAHVVVEEAPERELAGESRPWHLLTLSARTGSALEAATAELARHLERHPGLDLADVAYTGHVGRKSFPHRRTLVCQSLKDARDVLATGDAGRLMTGVAESGDRSVAFLFPGQGSQYPQMGRELYQSEAVFREQIDTCSKILKPHLGLDLSHVLYSEGAAAEEAARQLSRTAVTQPALFVVEYALARLLMTWGVRPAAMIGHSVGEYVAACLAGVFSLDDALALLAARGRLMQQQPAGAMLAVPLSERETRSLLGSRLSLAAINEPSRCVVSGPVDAVGEFERQLTEKGLGSRRLDTSHAYHSEMMEPVLEPFTGMVARINLRPPQIPFASNVTGTWITSAEAIDPNYWARHLRQTVRFAAGLGELSRDSSRVLVEVGPGRTLSDIARRAAHADKQVVLAAMPSRHEPQPALGFLLNALGQLWLAGVPVDWSGFHAHERRHRLPLPTYPFERERYWIEPEQPGTSTHRSIELSASSTRRKSGIENWFYRPGWQRSMPLEPVAIADWAKQHRRWLVFIDECGLGSQLVQRLEHAGCEVITVSLGEQFSRITEHSYSIAPQQPGHYDALLAQLQAMNQMPSRIVHLWSVTASRTEVTGIAAYDKAQALGFYSLLFLAQALGRQNTPDEVHIAVVSTDLQDVTGEETLRPEKATISGPCRVIPQEYTNITCRSIDVTLADSGSFQQERLIEQLLIEVATKESDQVVAYRGGHRWVPDFKPLQLDEGSPASTRLRAGGVYLITGGLGGIGLVLAEYLAQTVRAKLVLAGRSAFPEKHEWDRWLTTHDEGDAVSRKIRKIQALEASGSEVLIVRANVADSEEMQQALRQVRARFGEINGVIHAAGVAGGGLMQLKAPGQAAAVLEPKVRGTLVLDELLKGTELDFFVLCSSVNAIVGGYGQVDYCAANVFLDAFAHRKHSGTNTPYISINWDTWQEVGMAVDAMRRLSPSPVQRTPRNQRTGHPLLGPCIDENAGREVYSSALSVADHWVLGEHRIIAKDGVMPGTGYLEMARAAFAKHAGTGTIELRNVLFLTPLRVRDDETKEIQTIMEKDGDRFQFSIRSRSESSDEAGWQVHASGKIGVVESSPVQHNLEKLRERCRDREKSITEAEQNRIEERGFGPRWHTVQRLYVGAGEMLASLELPGELSADLSSYGLHPALLDVATGFAQFYAADAENYLPLSYGALKIKGDLPRKLYSHARLRNGFQSHSELVTYDIVVMDENGTELLEIREFTLKKIHGAAQTTTELQKLQRNPVALALQTALEEGIRSEEGVEAFRRILSRNLSPQVVVCTKDLDAIKERAFVDPAALLVANNGGKPAAAGPTHPRPELQTSYVAPRNELEQRIAEIWQELLGIESVGINDNFFELGGDSVLAIQIIARVRQTGLQLTPPQFFQQPTVAGLAAIAEPVKAGPEVINLRQPAEDETYSAANFPLAGLDAQGFSELSAIIENIDREELSAKD